MKIKLLATIVALQCLWVVATVSVQEFRLGHATVVLLETRPIDPRDYLRGDYVTLNYKISRLPVTLFASPMNETPKMGTPVYVKLVKHGEFFEAEQASLEPIPPETGHPVLRAEVSDRWAWLNSRSAEFRGPNAPRSISVVYGLEQYFVREGTGDPTGKLTVEVAVPASGQGLIREVFVDGKRYTDAMRGTGN